MPKLSHKAMIIISGLVWFAIGCILMEVGVRRLLSDFQAPLQATADSHPVVYALGNTFGGLIPAALALLVAGLFVGFFKGKYVLGKTAMRSVARIRALPNPSGLGTLYSPTYYLLIALMIGLGASMRFLGVPSDVRGLIDVAVGSALINGALVYFRAAFSHRTPAAT